MSAVTVRIPGPPPHELSPNRSHGNQRARTRLKAEMRRDWHLAIVAARNAIRPYPRTPVFDGLVFCEITYARPKGGQAWDQDNLLATLKVGLDQLQKDGIVANDRNLRYIVQEQIKDPEGRGYVEIVLTQVAA